MIKFVYTTDWHIKSLPSQSIEINNFVDTFINRIKIILNTECDFIIHGGDFFDSYKCEDLSLFNKIVDLLREFKKRIYVLPGNHDLIGYEPKSLNWTSLKTLECAGLITILPEGYYVIDGIKFFNVYPNKKHSPEIYKDLSSTFVITHNLIGPSTLPFKVTLTDEIKPYVNMCLFLCGDLHQNFVKIYDNCAFFNPGPLIRLDCSEYKGSGFFEFYFDPETFSCKYKLISFPDIDFSFKSVEREVEEIVLKFEGDFKFSIENIVKNICDSLYPNDNLYEEVYKWIEITKKSLS